MSLPLVMGHIAIDSTCLIEEGDETGSIIICPFRVGISSLYFDLFSLEKDTAPFCGHFSVDFLGAIS